MEHTHLGTTGLEVSRLCLGCAGFATSDRWPWTVTDPAQGVEVIQHAIENGITFLDTANVYSSGESEEVVGEAIAGRRDDCVIASKVGEPLEDRPNRRGLSRGQILEQVERTLERLGTDYLDLYYAHQWDPHTPIRETLSAFDHLIDEGLVRYIGASNWTSWNLVKALYMADAEHFERFAVIQPEYNLIRRHEEENLLAVAEQEGLGVVSYSPLAAGFLTGIYDRDTDRETLRAEQETWRDLGEFAVESNWTVLDRVREIAEREGATPVQVSLAWLLHKEVVTAPIIGAQTIEHVDEYLGGLEVSLSEDDLARLEAPIEPTWSRSMVAGARW